MLSLCRKFLLDKSQSKQSKRKPLLSINFDVQRIFHYFLLMNIKRLTAIHRNLARSDGLVKWKEFWKRNRNRRRTYNGVGDMCMGNIINSDWTWWTRWCCWNFYDSFSVGFVLYYYMVPFKYIRKSWLILTESKSYLGLISIIHLLNLLMCRLAFFLL